EKPLTTYDYYILSALAWFVIQAVYEALFLVATISAVERAELLALVRTWQGAMRDVQIHGFALLMILGVSQRVFPNFYSLPTGSSRVSLFSLLLLNVAIIGEVISLIFMQPGNHAWAAGWYVSVLLLTGTVFFLVRSWHLFTPSTESDRSLKFLRT